MNNCFWYSTNVCSCETCTLNKCEDFVDINSPRGVEMTEIYELYLKEAFQPIRDRLKRLFKFKEK